MENFPEPLTPPDCDLQDFKFMPLDVARLRDSDLASDETPEACWAAVLLWSASWHQIPAASIPDNDQWIAKAAGYAQRGRIAPEWAGVREGALRGWIKCSDGRLYHPVVAEKAVDAWESKLDQRHRTECSRIKKHNDRHGTSIARPSFDEWVSQGCPSGQRLFVPGDTNTSPKGQTPDVTGDKPVSPQDVPRETHSKGQGERQGQGQGQILIPSVTTVTGTDGAKSAAELTKDELWKAGKSLLNESGLPLAQCGSFVGKLVKDYGDEVVINAVRAAVVARPADPVEYLKKACMNAVGQRAQPNKQIALEERNRKVAEEWAAQG